MNGGAGKNTDGDAAVRSPFITQSDILNELNRHISDLSAYDASGSIQQEQESGYFELQKKLPDGSAIPASPSEIAANDFKNKLEQSAKYISSLESSEERQNWAEQQRLTGNSFFKQGDYKGAMDIYLTCLVVKESTPDFVRDTFLPVLNNLAQCTLQLGMHTKTILFCEMALEEVSKAKEKAAEVKASREEKKGEEGTPELALLAKQRDLADAIALCKIFFKLSKALRLTGHYGKARKALDNSHDCLVGEDKEMVASSYAVSGDADGNNFSLAPYKKAIQKEYRCLEIAEREARKNFARQKLAMQSCLSSSSTAKSKSTTTRDKNETHSSSSGPLYEQSTEPRQFSTLRARKTETSSQALGSGDHMNSYVECNSEKTSYSQYYWSMVGRVAKALLVLLGEEDDEGGSNYNSEGTRTRKKRV